MRPMPKVLGASIDLRGTRPQLGLKPVLTALNGEQIKHISAKSYLVFDLESGQVLAQKDLGRKLGIASLTKLMTGLLAYQNLDFNSSITIGNSGLKIISPSVGFAEGDQVRAGDIFNAMIVGSCNDAAQILAKEVRAKTGVNFVLMMNQKAQELQMTSTSFTNPSGFDSPDGYSTAADLAKLITATQHLSTFSNLGLTSSLSFNGKLGLTYKVTSTNKLIQKVPNLLAIKTGNTQISLGAMVSKVPNNGHQIIIVVLGSRNREADTLILKSAVAEKIIWQ